MKFVSLLAFALIFFQVKAQFPISPNAFDAQGKRTGHWTVLYDSSWRETQNPDSAFHYRLARFESGKPMGKVRDFFRNGVKQWDGYLLSVLPDVQDGEVNYYFENGKIQYHYQAKEGKKNGFYQEFNQNGILISQTTFKEDSAEGKWVIYTPEGFKHSESEWKDNKPNGTIVFYYPSGKIEKKGFKIMQRTEGVWEEFYESGQLKSRDYFKNNVHEGTSENYFENGALQSKGQYANDHKIGPWSYHHENGKLKSTGTYDSEGNRTGLWKAFFENGNLNSAVIRKDEKLNGQYEDYHENGKLKTKGTCQDDLWQGLLEGYYENGQLAKRGAYTLDSMDGAWIFYHENGALSSEGSYINQKKNGLWKYYTSAGNLETAEMLSMGVLNGSVINYYSNGNVSEKKEFVQGKENGLYQSFYEDGKKKSEGNKMDNLREGEWLLYHPNGQLDSKENYHKGLWEGAYITFHPNGIKRSEGAAHNDLNEGYRKFYYIHGKLKGEGNMHQGVRNGHWIFYDSLTGTKESEGEYVNGKTHGKWKYYLSKTPVSYYMNGWEETFYNIKDSLLSLLNAGKVEAATKTLSWMDKVRKRDFKNAVYEKTMMLYWKGFLANTEEKHSLALKYDNQFLKEIKKLKGDTCTEYRNGSNNLALALSAMGRMEEGMKLLKDIAEIYIKKPTEESGDITSYENVASVYDDNKKYQDEVLYLEQILARRKAKGKNNPRYTFQLKNSLGVTYIENLQEIEKGRAVFNSIIHQADSLSITDDIYYGNALYRIGLLYRNDYNRTESIRYFKKAAAIQKKQIHEAPSYCMIAMNVLGYSYLRLGKADSASLVFTEMEDLIQKIGWQNTIWQAKYLQAVGEIFLDRYENRKAVESWLQAKEILERIKKTRNIEYAEVLQALSVSLPAIDITQSPVAESYLLQAISIVEKLEGNSAKYRSFLISLAELYNNSSNFDKATEVLTKAMKAVKEAERGNESPKLAECENLYAENEYDLGHYTEAIVHGQNALRIMEPIKKEDPNIYIDALSWLSVIYSELNDGPKAELYIRQAVQGAREFIGEESMTLINQLQDLAKVLRDLNRYSEAEKVYKEAEALVKKNFGEENIKFAYLINAQANLQRENQNFKKALQGYLRYQPLISKVAGEESPSYLTLLTNLAFTYDGLKDKPEAEKYHLQALRLALKIYGNQNSEYAWKLKNVADFYSEKGDHSIAEKYISEATQIQLSVYGENNTEYASFLKYLAGAKIRVDKFKDGEALLQKAVSINKKSIADHFGSYISSVEELQDFYLNFGRYNEALDQVNTILPLIASKWGMDSRYAINLIEKANIFLGMDKYDSARAALGNALPILEEKFAPTHWSVLDAHNLLGILDLKEKKPAEAEKHFRFCVDQRKIAGEENTNIQATSLSNLAATLLEKGELEEAKSILNLSNQLNTKLGSKVGLDYNHLHFGKLYQLANQPELAEINFKQAMENRKSAILRNFYFLSDNEKAQFWKANRFFIDYFQSFALQRIKSNPSIVQDLYNLQLNTKGILLSSSNKIKKRILSSNDSSMIAHYYQWLKQRDQLAQLYTLGKEELKEKKNKLDSLEGTVKVSEKELNITAEDLEKDKGKETTWREVQRALSPNEAAIEIIRIRYHKTHPTDSLLYAALVLTSEMKNGPTAVVMPNGKLLEGRGLRFYKNAALSQLPDTLSYRIYWAAIEDLVKNKSKVYLSLDGVYNSINLNTLHTPQGKYLIDTKTISLVSNTKDILLLKKKNSTFNRSTASLIGFPTYFLGKEKLRQKAARERDIDFAKISEEDQSGIAELPGTKTEIEKIDNILHAHKWNVTSFTDEYASEEAIKEIRQPALLHIATHGFFVDEKNTSSWMSSSDPMLRAGLLFTGAANFLQDKISVTDDNGILTAYEAANLNLDNTEMVILSACETGKGEVQNGEGVYGLQRAFQTAGAKSILMSLWKVDDTATQELMTLFYQNWTSGKSKSEAFKQAQLSLKEKYPSPYYWGAFVMMGE